MATIPAPGSQTGERSFPCVNPHPLPHDDICPLAQINVVSPSWAWRSGVSALIAERLPELPMTCHAKLPTQIPSVPSVARHAVLLDGAMAHGLVLDWIDVWQRTNVNAQVVVIDTHGDTETLSAYFAAGIVGYTTLGEGESAIIATMDDLQTGTVHCSQDIITRLVTVTGADRFSSPLSPRETDVLNLIARDLSNQEIADALTVEISTVKHHVHNILHKLDAKHRWHAVSAAKSEGWLGKS
jgi:DNA-binding NarL/FixJ family response regulator